MMSKILVFQNESKYCHKNPSKYTVGGPTHYYVNDNCMYCKCEKTYKINIMSRVADYFNKFN